LLYQLRHCYTISEPFMKTSDFDFHLPPGFIAQTPVEPRDQSRLMVLDRRRGTMEHRRFFEIVEYLRAGDVLVFNDSRVIPARVKGKKAGTGGRIELLLLRRRDSAVWEALVKPAKRVDVGTRLELAGDAGAQVAAEVTGLGEEGVKVIRFSDEERLLRLGEVPLPPYIHAPLADAGRYQTVYARAPGSAAAPTAGLHFTPELLERIEDGGVKLQFVTLHIGLDTFRPVREENPLNHRIHKEYGIITGEVADELSRAKKEGRRIICAGTTTVRLVEAAAQGGSPDRVPPFEGWVSLLALPGYRFRMTGAMLTNFHLPRSTLLMLVAAFAGRDFILAAYEEAIAQNYRFYSFGDAMLIL
jgi:S-adenosylmethionine:tRNA ribosyltransferase-isomerase